MATVTEVKRACDVCGNVDDVTTRTFGLDGTVYEIDLCQEDGNALDRVAVRYIAKARKVTAKQRHGQRGGRPRSRPAGAASGDRAKERGAAGGHRRKSIYVYGILPADIEVAVGIPGVGKHPGLLRDVRFDGLAALISEVDSSGQLGSPDDLRIHQEILDATAAEVPVLPLRFGTILTSEDAVAEDLLAAHHDEFSAALDRLEGRVEFQVKGRYVKDAVEARPDEDTRALTQAMERLCVASVAREPTGELEAVHVAFLVPVDQEAEVEQVIEDLAREWEGRIDLLLLGPMAAYDFAGTAQPGS